MPPQKKSTIHTPLYREHQYTYIWMRWWKIYKQKKYTQTNSPCERYIRTGMWMGACAPLFHSSSINSTTKLLVCFWPSERIHNSMPPVATNTQYPDDKIVTVFLLHTSLHASRVCPILTKNNCSFSFAVLFNRFGCKKIAVGWFATL